MKMWIILAVGAFGFFSALPSAIAVNQGENPYAPIPQRNLFGLVPIPVHDPAQDIPVTPPPKITPNGIMTIFGKVQVLFKVQATPAPGQPPKELSYTMGEGERQDEIEVQKIDEKAASITFNNHGQVQTLELSKSAGGAAPAQPPVPGQPGVLAASAMANPGAPGGVAPSQIGFGGRFGRARNNSPMNPTEVNPAPGVGTLPNFNNGGNQVNNSHPVSTASPEEQVIMIEAQRMHYQQMGDPVSKIFPHTELTPIIRAENGEPSNDPSQGGLLPE